LLGVTLFGIAVSFEVDLGRGCGLVQDRR
jgi:hypothetical protein